MDNSLNIDINDYQPSLCIPRIFENVTQQYIQNIFEQLNLGKINRVDIINRKTEKGQQYKRVFIHFHKWNTNDDSINARHRLLSGKDIKIVYDNPWFWKVSANKWDIK